MEVMKKSEKWWSGRLEGKVGWFPKTFVKILEEEEATAAVQTQTVPTKTVATKTVSPAPRPETTPTAAAELYKALYDYESAESCDLQFKTGDIIQVRGPCNVL